ncbi:MAG: hypothetical protein R3F23_01795 [Verrucomicrobiia bacterium]
MSKKKVGRPKKPKSKIKKVFPIRLSDEERRIIEIAAKTNREKPSKWARNVLIQAAKTKGG